MQGHINIGFKSDITIAELASAIAKAVDYKGKIVFESNKPDGAPRKLMDSSLINKLGWFPKVDLETGLKAAYISYVRQLSEF
jgi:GDP-L-fucose synthase